LRGFYNKGLSVLKSDPLKDSAYLSRSIFEWFKTMWGKQILARAIEIQKDKMPLMAFSRDA